MNWDLEYIRPLKKLDLVKRANEIDITYHPNVTIYSNATILPYRKKEDFSGLGGVVDSQGNYIDDSSEKFAIGAYETGEVGYREEKVCYCGHLLYQWGHFLMDSLSRIWYCLENDSDIDKYVFYGSESESRELTGNYRQFFELLGIWHKVEIINIPTCFSEVVIPEKSYIDGECISSEFVDVFDKIAANIEVDSSWITYDKIYFTRKSFKKAKELDIGAEMLDDYFERNGFELISPEKLSLSNMIYLIRNSKIVASTSGSICHNMMFANNEQSLIVAERAVLNNSYQIAVNLSRQLNVTIVDANISLYPVEIGYGPFIIANNKYLQKLTKNKNWIPPSAEFTSNKYYTTLFRKYMKAYKKNYYNRWIFEDWMISHTVYLREAYKEAEILFFDYLYGLKPYKFSQYFQIRFIKQFVKKLIK